MINFRLKKEELSRFERLLGQREEYHGETLEM
jgi:hypothetical protein